MCLCIYANTASIKHTHALTHTHTHIRMQALEIIHHTLSRRLLDPSRSKSLYILHTMDLVPSSVVLIRPHLLKFDQKCNRISMRYAYVHAWHTYACLFMRMLLVLSLNYKWFFSFFSDAIYSCSCAFTQLLMVFFFFFRHQASRALGFWLAAHGAHSWGHSPPLCAVTLCVYSFPRK